MLEHFRPLFAAVPPNPCLAKKGELRAQQTAKFNN